MFFAVIACEATFLVTGFVSVSIFVDRRWVFVFICFSLLDLAMGNSLLFDADQVVACVSACLPTSLCGDLLLIICKVFIFF